MFIPPLEMRSQKLMVTPIQMLTGLAVADGLVFGLADAVTFGLTDGLAEGVVLLSAPQPAEIPSTNKIDRITHAFFIKYLHSILGTISPFCYIL